jgi:uncharacterized protein
MEEILASIRRIISEDEPQAAAAAAEPAPAPAPAAPAAAPAPVFHAPEPPVEDVLELTDRLDAPAPAYHAPEPAPEPFRPSITEDIVPAAPPRAAASAPAVSFGEDDGLLSAHKAASVSSHFGALSQSIAMPAEGRTLEDVVRELLRPLLKDWLDTHLETIVQERVQAEVERLSRRRV